MLNSFVIDMSDSTVETSNIYQIPGLIVEDFVPEDGGEGKVDVSGAIVPVEPYRRPDKLSYKAVERLIHRTYGDTETLHSTALDILAVYLKGQKILYTEAKTVCEQRLHTLMLPAIMISALCTLLSLALRDYSAGATVVALLNAINSFLLALVSYLKLDAKAEAHKTTAYKFDKLQSYCEIKSGKVLFIEDKNTNINDIINDIEDNVRDIKETNQFILPEKIRFGYKELYGTNVFSNVKRIQNEEMILINQLKGVINAMITLNEAGATYDVLLTKEDEQNQIIEKIIEKRNDYLEMDGLFNAEIRANAEKSARQCKCMSWLKT